jgi:GNAT superfamily N-acetyltransferase
MNCSPAIRKVTPEDAEIILKLVNRPFVELHRHPPMGDGKSVSFCKSILESGKYVTFISEDHQGSANSLIALSQALSIYTGGMFGVIREFYVVPEARSTGVGKALLETAKGFAANSGWKRLEAPPPDKDKWFRTYDFYIREGFSEIGPRLKLEDPETKKPQTDKAAKMTSAPKRMNIRTAKIKDLPAIVDIYN